MPTVTTTATYTIPTSSKNIYITNDYASPVLTLDATRLTAGRHIDTNAPIKSIKISFPGATVSYGGGGYFYLTNNGSLVNAGMRITGSSGNYYLWHSLSTPYVENTYPLKLQIRGDASTYTTLTVTSTVNINYQIEVTYTYNATNPNPPIKQAPTGSGATYNTSPRVLLTLGTNTAVVSIGSNASLVYSLSGAAAQGRKVVAQPSAPLTAPMSFSANVYAVDGASGLNSSNVAISGTLSSPTYNQPTLTPGATKVKAVDINELAQMLKNVCAYYGMTAPSWPDNPIVANTTPLSQWSSHINELRTCIDNIRVFVNDWDSNNTTLDIPAIDWIPITTNTPTAAVMNQIRDVMLLL